MTDKELAAYGERLYEAVLLTPLPAGSILGLATAIRYNAPWSELPQTLRFAVFKIASACLSEAPDEPHEEATPEPRPSPAAEEPGITPDGSNRESRSPADPPGGAAPLKETATGPASEGARSDRTAA
jgi:hypothetical protein